MTDTISTGGSASQQEGSPKRAALSHADAIQAGKRLVRETLPRRWKLFALSIICMVGTAGFTGALAYSTKLIVNDVFVEADASAAIRVALLVIGISFAKSLFSYGNSVISVLFNRSVSADYQKRAFNKLVNLDISYFTTQHATAQMARLRLFGDAAGKSMVSICNQLSTDILTLIALLGVMFFQDPVMTLACAGIIPLIFLLVSRLSKKVREAAAAENALIGGFFAVGAEALDGIKTVKSFQLEKKAISRFEAAVEQLQARLYGIAKITAATVPIMELLGGIVIGLFVIYAAWQTVTFGQTPGEFTAFITAFLLAYAPAERISQVWVELQKKLVQVNMLFDLLDKQPKQAALGSVKLTEDAPLSVVFDDVSFIYGSKKAALRNASFEIKGGERVAIVGRSGAGKSTLIDLLQRFYDPTNGVVRIGSNDIKTIENDSLRQSISLISQDVFLFEGTLAENIRDGSADASDAEVLQAAERAQLTDLISEHPAGIDLKIGPNGAMLSGGQRQRIGLARALVKKAKIYIFDEATSALDSVNERIVLSGISKAMRGATIIYVSHRVSTLVHVDRALVLSNGEIVAFDTPDRLLQDNAEFQDLFRGQPADRNELSDKAVERQNDDPDE